LYFSVILSFFLSKWRSYKSSSFQELNWLLHLLLYKSQYYPSLTELSSIQSILIKQ